MRRALNKQKKPITIQRFVRGEPPYPETLISRLGESAPAVLTAIGPIELLANRKTALFCSARTPGDAILRAYDMARRLRDWGITVISGFHSPIERECLRILLRGQQPLIICPARAIERMRIPIDCRTAFEAGRIMYLSPFIEKPRRVDRESAIYRNQVVAALADEVYFAHVQPGGETERLSLLLKKWAIPIIGK